MPEFITEVAKTSVTKGYYGWTGKTYLKINGFAYEITTMKTSSGMITSNAQKLSGNKIENGFVCTSFMMFKDMNIAILREKANATEAKIKELHFKALALVDTMQDKFPKAEAYKIEPGQIIFVDWIQSEPDYQVIYRIDDGTAYHVNTKTLQMGREEVGLIRPYSEKFGIGTYYNEGERMDMDAVSNLVIEAQAKIKREEEERPALEAKAKAELAIQKQAIEEQYPYLQKVTNRHGGVHVAVNLRIELKREFPAVRFSVRSDYSSINIDWEDGPTTDQVKALTDKWEDHVTDYTGDYRDYSPSIFNDVFGGCNYIFENRKMSPETHERFHKWAAEIYAGGNDFGTNCKESLAWQQFYHNVIPQGEWELVHNNTLDDDVIGAPSPFWRVVGVQHLAPVIAISQPTEKQSVEPVNFPCLQPSGVVVTRNNDKGGIEIRFPAKPSESVISDLKAQGFRWSGFNKCWWVKYSEHSWKYAHTL